MSIILGATPNGIIQKDLVIKARVHRDTVYDECKILEQDGLIAVERIGRNMIYRATQKALDKDDNVFYLRANILREELFSKLTTLGTDSSYYIPNFGSIDGGIENRKKKRLFEFSLRVAEIIAHVLIQAMNPVFINKLSSEHNVSSRLAKNALVEQWIDNTMINPTQLLSAFSQIIYGLGYDFPAHNFAPAESKRLNNHSSYELSHESFTKLEGEYAQLFPAAHSQLKYHYVPSSPYIMEPRSIEEVIEEKIGYYKKRMKQRICKHEYKEAPPKNGNKYFECSICKDHVTISITKLVKNEDLIKKIDALKLKPTPVKCDKHVWIECSMGQDVRLANFYCQLCNGIAILPVMNIKKLKQIDDAVSVKLGDRYLRLCNEVECAFELHRDEDISVKNLLKHRTEFLKSFYAQVTKVAINDRTLDDILDILVKYRFIVDKRVLGYNPANNPVKRIFIRKNRRNESY